jgi:hypothetical protein
MIAETISLGILSLPSAIATLGLAGSLFFLSFPSLLPKLHLSFLLSLTHHSTLHSGCTLILTFGILACYTGITYGHFKLRHPQVVTAADAGYVLAGRVGRELVGWASTLVLIFIMAAHVTSFGVMMNVLTNHATCTIAWYVVGFVVSLGLTLPRTMKSLTPLSVICKFSFLCWWLVAFDFWGSLFWLYRCILCDSREGLG